jgi:hypothetical protein
VVRVHVRGMCCATAHPRSRIPAQERLDDLVTTLINTMDAVAHPGSGPDDGHTHGFGAGADDVDQWQGEWDGTDGGGELKASLPRAGALGGGGGRPLGPVPLRAGLSLALRRIVNLAGVREEAGLPVRVGVVGASLSLEGVGGGGGHRQWASGAAVALHAPAHNT